MSLIGNGNTHKALIGCLSCPIDSNAPGIQLAMWLGEMKIFRTMLCTLCQKLLLYSICNYVASTAYRGTVFAFRVSLLVNFMYFYYFCVFHREFLWPTGAKWVSTLIFRITGIRDCLNAKRLFTNHALFNASHSIYLFLAQWRLVLSESAVSCFIKCCYYITTTVITTVTMFLSYSYVVPQDTWIILLVKSN